MAHLEADLWLEKLRVAEGLRVAVGHLEALRVPEAHLEAVRVPEAHLEELAVALPVRLGSARAGGRCSNSSDASEASRGERPESIAHRPSAGSAAVAERKDGVCCCQRAAGSAAENGICCCQMAAGSAAVPELLGSSELELSKGENSLPEAHAPLAGSVVVWR